MGGDFIRRTLISDVNTALHTSNVQTSAQAVQHLAADPDADILDYLHHLGCLNYLGTETLDSYRQRLAIPPANWAVLTNAFRVALHATPAALPLTFDIRQGASERVEVTVLNDTVEVVLTRHAQDGAPPVP
jgi:hypothetical protein